MEIAVPFGKTDAVSRLGRGDDHFFDAKLHRRLDDIVGAHRVDAERFVVWLEQDARHSSEMNHRVKRLWTAGRFQIVKPCMHRKGVEHLAAVGDVGADVGDARMVERRKVDVEDFVALVGQPRQNMPPRLARAAGERNTFCHDNFPDSRVCAINAPTVAGVNLQTSRFQC